MIKKLFVLTILVAISSLSCAAKEPNFSQNKIDDSAVTAVKNEIAGYKDLTKLQKAQMLVSHRSVEDETKIRKEACVSSKNKNAKAKIHKETAKKVDKAVVLSKKEIAKNRLSAEPNYSNMKFSERLKAKYGIEPKKKLGKSFPAFKNNNAVKQATSVNSSSLAQNNALDKELQKSRLNEERLKKENEALKNEIRKNIAAMKKIKESAK